MIHHTIQGVRVPALGFGTWRLAGRECRDAVEHALALGYRHLDTAQGYHNETEVGAALARSGVPRDEVFLVTKLAPDNFRRADALRTTRESLRRLGVERIDLLLLHWPNPEVPLAETLDALGELVDEGAVARLGVSNFPPSLTLQARRHAAVFANQVEYHPFLAQEPLLGQAREQDYLLTAYCPLARGAVLDDPTLREIADAHRKTPAQVTLRWLVQQPKVAAIPKAASEKHREGNLDIFDFELSSDEMQRIHALARGHRIVDPEDAPDWEN